MAGHGIGPLCRRHLTAALQLLVNMAERIDIRIEDPGDSAEIEVIGLRVAAGDRVKKGSVVKVDRILAVMLA
jgi:hypothetical protein